ERHKIARLNTDGSLDTGFNPGTGADRAVYTTAIQSDGKIIIGGDFTTYNGTARIRIARLNSDGSLDAGFNPGTGANYIINTTAIQSDGKIIIGGSFTAYNGTIRSRVARVIGGTSLSSSSDYFRTITSGNWNAPATWESAKDAAFTTGVVSPATLSPDFNAHTITIQNTHTVFITANITIGQTTLNSGGAIVVNPNIVLTVK
ncbi:MAG: delta-60 repeat domain-containing protein, partial [Ferruginibacter sp.]